MSENIGENADKKSLIFRKTRSENLLAGTEGQQSYLVGGWEGRDAAGQAKGASEITSAVVPLTQAAYFISLFVILTHS